MFFSDFSRGRELGRATELRGQSSELRIDAGNSRSESRVFSVLVEHCLFAKLRESSCESVIMIVCFVLFGGEGEKPHAPH